MEPKGGGGGGAVGAHRRNGALDEWSPDGEEERQWVTGGSAR
jgi:hypothetical protein